VGEAGRSGNTKKQKKRRGSSSASRRRANFYTFWMAREGVEQISRSRVTRRSEYRGGWGKKEIMDFRKGGVTGHTRGSWN